MSTAPFVVSFSQAVNDPKPSARLCSKTTVHHSVQQDMKTTGCCLLQVCNLKEKSSSQLRICSFWLVPGEPSVGVPSSPDRGPCLLTAVLAP